MRNPCYKGTFMCLLLCRNLSFLRFRIIHAEGFNGHGLDLLLVQRAVAVIGVGISDLVYDIHALGDFSESSVSAVQMGGCFVHDEELAFAMERTTDSCFRELLMPFWANSPLML